LDELVSNVINYGYPKEEGEKYFLNMKRMMWYIKIEIRDFGVPFNILEMKEVDVSLGIEERAIGGLGIHLVKI
jgi:serine/threonine-protein kinase RsbW